MSLIPSGKPGCETAMHVGIAPHKACELLPHSTFHYILLPNHRQEVWKLFTPASQFLPAHIFFIDNHQAFKQ